MFAGPIPTSAGNSRIAALAARKKPTIDVNAQGIGVEAGGGVSPMLSNRVEAFSDRGLAGVEQRGFSSGREAIATAMDAAGRTMRVGEHDARFERENEAAEVDRRMLEADSLHKQRTSNAMHALKTRAEADLYFDPAVSRVRDDETTTRASLYNAQNRGSLAKAGADITVANTKAATDLELGRLESAANIADSRLTGGSKALEAIAALKGGLRQPTAEKTPGLTRLWGLLGGGTPASDPDAEARGNYETQAQRIMGTLGFDQRQAPGTAPPQGQAQGPDPTQVRTQQIQMFAQEYEIDPAQAEQILMKNGVIR